MRQYTIYASELNFYHGQNFHNIYSHAERSQGYGFNLAPAQNRLVELPPLGNFQNATPTQVRERP